MLPNTAHLSLACHLERSERSFAALVEVTKTELTAIYVFRLGVLSHWERRLSSSALKAIQSGTRRTNASCWG
ncbi:MAG: hypothetical protein ACK44E_12290, partial [Anaerolineales bacterium]